MIKSNRETDFDDPLESSFEPLPFQLNDPYDLKIYKVRIDNFEFDRKNANMVEKIVNTTENVTSIFFKQDCKHASFESLKEELAFVV